jgi:aspartyl-tRNA(Asn)/glutamyl-tRNA(Gln) amidotransferase subunit C
MSPLTEKDIIKIAKLARIEVKKEEIPHFSKELSQILALATDLQNVDTAGVPQMTSVCAMRLSLRTDEVTDGNKVDDIVKNAPISEFGCFVVPKVIE